MNNLQQMEDIQNGTLDIVACKHDDGNKVYYYASIYKDLQPGDRVWVETDGLAPGNCMLTTVHMAGLHLEGYNGPVIQRFIVAKHDDKPFREYLDRKKLADALLKKMEERFAASARIARFEVAAQSDPAMASLMDQYKALIGK